MHGHLTEGRRWLETVAVASASAGGSPALAALRASVLFGAGGLAWSQGDLASARAHHEGSLSLRRELGDGQGIAASLNSLAIVAHLQGDHDWARDLYGESLRLA